MEQNRTVLEQLMEDVTSARIAGKPLVMLETPEIQVARDVVFHPNHPVGAIRQESGAQQMMLFFSKNPLPAGDAYLNIIWYDLAMEKKPKSSQASFHQKQQEYIKSDAPFVIVMNLQAASSSNNQLLDKKLAYLHDFVIEHALGMHQNSYILLYGDVGKLTEDLLISTQIIEVPYPKYPEIRRRIQQRIDAADLPEMSDSKIKADLKHTIDQIAQSMRGLTYVEVDALADYLVHQRSGGVPLLFCGKAKWNAVLNSHKQQSLKRSGNLLELLPESAVKIAGMGSFRRWVTDHKIRVNVNTAHELMRNTGTPAPKGALLHGTPGCGKSDAARLLQQEWGLPVLKMDIGRLMGGLVGDSERQMRSALRQAEACAPCILFIDELEKGLAGTSANAQTGSDTIKRMFSFLLSWLSDDRGETTVFVYATANSLKGLPNELYRKGRLDTLFSVSLPTRNECVDIFISSINRHQSIAQRTQEEDSGQKSHYRIFKEEEDSWREAIGALIDGPSASLLNPGKGKEPLFVSGVDIAEIVKLAMLGCEARVGKGLYTYPINFSEFIEEAHKAITSDTMSTAGSGVGNLRSLAAGYLNTLRGSFVPVSDDAEVFFKSSDYQEVLEKQDGYSRNAIKIRENPRYAANSSASPYDKKLYRELRKYMEETKPEML